MTEKIEKLLLKIGITPNLKGFYYICEIVEMLLENPGTKTTYFYEVIGGKYGVGNTQVEKGIKTAISHADFTALDDIPNTKDFKNAEFLHTIALLIKRSDKLGKQD